MNNEKYYQHFLENNFYPRSLKGLETVQGFSSLYLQKEGKRIINFSSNDYLGLSNHPLLIARSQAYAAQYGVGAASSRLVTGNFSCYTPLEKTLAQFLKKPSALILSSGYQANQSVLQALLNQQVLRQEPLVFCDKWCHASMIEGIRHLKHFQRFRHNDLTHLAELLEKKQLSTQPKFILAESIYSMEGDEANLAVLTQLAEQHHAFLYIDDAHSIGVHGPEGCGKAVDYADKIGMIMGTFSKALGSFGAYIACSELLKDYLVNKCRGLIYSTGLSPAILGAISAALEVLPQLDEARQRLALLSKRVRDYFTTENISFGHSSTHIIPWIIGDARKTLKASELLEERGILGTAIQPPSVPVGKSRIRLCISAKHSDEDIEHLLAAVTEVRDKILYC